MNRLTASKDRERQPADSAAPRKFTGGVMTVTFVLALLTSFAVPARPNSSGEMEPVSYSVDLRSPYIHLAGVNMVIPRPKPRTRIQFPTWTALYQIRDFVRNLNDLKAYCDGRRISLVREDVNTWHSGESECKELSISHSVYAVEDSVFASDLDEHHAFLNLAMLLFYLPDERDRPVRIQFYPMPAWKVATLLAGPDKDDWYAARNYDELVDNPVEAGRFKEYRYEQKGAEYRLVVHDEKNRYDGKRLVETVRKITDAATSMMKDVPYARYTFIYHFPPEGSGGGMEHLNGTAISISGATNWTWLESLTTHEFMHTWNVKRIRPQGLEPVDYIHGNDTRELWLCEGVTTTLANYVRLRAGLLSKESFYSGLANEINRLHERTARRLQSVEAAGRDAWLEKYPDYLRPERSISYYNKGEIVGYLLDLGMRHASGGRQGLDDLFHRLNKDFARPGRYYSRQDLLRILHDLVPEGIDFQEFFADAVSGTEELDYDRFFGYAGLKLKKESGEAPSLGFAAVKGFEGPLVVQSVLADTSAARAGLQPGDVLLEMNGETLQFASENLGAGLSPGREVRLRVLRGSAEREIRFRAEAAKETNYSIEEDDSATAAQKRLREAWLAGTTSGESLQ